jgi:hypothetical protein
MKHFPTLLLGISLWLCSCQKDNAGTKVANVSDESLILSKINELSVKLGQGYDTAMVRNAIKKNSITLQKLKDNTVADVIFPITGGTYSELETVGTQDYEDIIDPQGGHNINFSVRFEVLQARGYPGLYTASGWYVDSGTGAMNTSDMTNIGADSWNEYVYSHTSGTLTLKRYATTNGLMKPRLLPSGSPKFAVYVSSDLTSKTCSLLMNVTAN